MARISVQIKGLKELQEKFKGLPERMTKEIDAEIQLGSEEIERLAKRAAPADQGILRMEISNYKEKVMQWVTVSGADHSGFLEFGTRSLVRIPAGLEQVAAEVKAQKHASSLSAKEAIFAWCKRKGIEPRAWFAIYRKLMTVGVRPQPFFFMQLDVVAPNVIRNVKNVINSL